MVNLKVLIKKHIGNLALTESKIDSNFPNAQFRIEGFSMPFKLDCNRFGGGVLIYVWDEITCKHNPPDDKEGIIVDINL